MNWTRQNTRALIEAAADVPCITRGAVKVIRRHYAEDGLVERMAAFEDFCDRTNGRPSVWGESDCTLRVADWVAENGYPDPAAVWRGTYETEAECRALLVARGGLIGHVQACASDIGLKPIYEPEFGCIAVVGAGCNSDRQWSAIWNGARWLVLWGNEQAAHWTPFVAKPLGLWRV
jgi:hypothetical protein